MLQESIVFTIKSIIKGVKSLLTLIWIKLSNVAGNLLFVHQYTVTLT
jgi:hypothetical protein